MKSTTKTLITADAGLPDALWASFVAPVMSGSQGLVAEVGLGDVPRLADLFPLGSVRSDVRLELQRMVLASGADWAALALSYSHRTGAKVFVRAASVEALRKAVAMVRANAPVAEEQHGIVEVDFWQSAASHSYTMTRSIDAPAWTEIAANYPTEVAEAVGALAQRRPAADQGRIILWHGPPGTGKTTAIRSLGREWSGWARFQVVLDPEPILGSAATLMQVLLADSGDADWRVLVIEDADAIVGVGGGSPSAANTTLSRLLNVGDGIVGQGTRVLVLLTTNERPERLHPALRRPGRCLSNVFFRRFTRAEAAAITDEQLPPGPDFSLAELKGRTADEPVVATTGPSSGAYL